MSGLKLEMSVMDMPEVVFEVRRTAAEDLRVEADGQPGTEVGRLVALALRRIAADTEAGVRSSGYVEKSG